MMIKYLHESYKISIIISVIVLTYMYMHYIIFGQQERARSVQSQRVRFYAGL